MGNAEVIRLLSEYLYYKSKFPDFSVLLHNYEIVVKARELMAQENELKEFSDEEKSLLVGFGDYIILSENKSEKNKFLSRYTTPITTGERNELKKRISEIEMNPEIGISKKEVLKGIEEILGEQLSISSGN